VEHLASKHFTSVIPNVVLQTKCGETQIHKLTQRNCGTKFYSSDAGMYTSP